MEMSLHDLGDELGVDPADLAVLVEQMVDLHYDELPLPIALELRDILDVHHARTIPELHGFEAHPDHVQPPWGLGVMTKVNPVSQQES